MLDIDKNIRQNINYALKHDGPFRWSKILGFSKEELKRHLELNFKDGMTFDNYGELWGVSFIIPHRCYNLNNDTDLQKCWSLKNLKPEYLINCYRQKKQILRKDIEEYSLWDILPEGNLNIKN